MLQRRKRMTVQERQNCEKSLLDDAPMSTAIENARLLPLSWEELHNVERQIAGLRGEIKIFGRSEINGVDPDNPYADLIFPIETAKTKKLGIRKTSHAELEVVPEIIDQTNPHKRRGPECDMVIDRSLNDHSPPTVDANKSEPAKKKKRVGFAAQSSPEPPCHMSFTFSVDDTADRAESSVTAARRLRSKDDNAGPSVQEASLEAMLDPVP